jgi:hypothetical protein
MRAGATGLAARAAADGVVDGDSGVARSGWYRGRDASRELVCVFLPA